MKNSCEVGILGNTGRDKKHFRRDFHRRGVYKCGVNSLATSPQSHSKLKCINTCIGTAGREKKLVVKFSCCRKDCKEVFAC